MKCIYIYSILQKISDYLTSSNEFIIFWSDTLEYINVLWIEECPTSCCITFGDIFLSFISSDISEALNEWLLIALFGNTFIK